MHKMAPPAQCKQKNECQLVFIQRNVSFERRSINRRFFFQPVGNESEHDRLELYSPIMQRCCRRKARDESQTARQLDSFSDFPLSKASRNLLNKTVMHAVPS